MFTRDDLFRTISAFQTLIEKQKTDAKDCLLLDELLNGNAHFKGLHDLAKRFELNNAILIHNEIKTFYLQTPITKAKLKLVLKSAKSTLSHIISAAQKQQQDSCAFKKTYADQQDDIYQKTIDKFNGTIIVPITQTFDYRLAASAGDCAGYVIAWMQSLLSEQPPFGIRHNFGALFRPIKFNSRLGRKYPDLNHIAVVTSKISVFQHDIKSNKLLLYDCDGRRRIYRGVLTAPAFYKNVEEIADKLNEAITQNRDNIYYLALHHGIRGHALGFYFDNNNCYHFLDVNSGWYKFSSYEFFSNWLVFYFKTKKYDQKYPEFLIYSFGFTLPKKMPLKQWISHQFRFFAAKCGNEFKENINLLNNFNGQVNEIPIPPGQGSSNDTITFSRLDQTSIDDSFLLKNQGIFHKQKNNIEQQRRILALIDIPL